jgi:hypothetical protein
VLASGDQFGCQVVVHLTGTDTGQLRFEVRHL